MNEIEQLRANMRQQIAPAARTGLRLLVLAAAATAAGFAVLWLVIQLLLPPQPYASVSPLQPSASLPTFDDVRASITAGQPPPTYRPDPAVQSAPRVAPDYQGKSASEIGKVADAVCFQQAHARYPHWSKTPRLTTKELSDFTRDSMDHFNELLRCLLSEGLMRYCSKSERRMIASEIAMYFRGIEYSNRILDRFRKLLESAPHANSSDLQRANTAYITVDMTVEAAIGARLSDGLLTAADRDRFIAAVPQHLRDRLLRTPPPKSACPHEPWWAFWQ